MGTPIANSATEHFLPTGANMQIGSLGAANSMWDLAAINKVNDEDDRYSNIASQTTPSGDRVDISDEAKRLYSEMIHKYDGASRTAGKTADTGEETSGAPAGGGGGSGGSESSDSQVEKIKGQIQSLKSQIMALASQAQAQGPGGAATSQINALEAQVAALEAQLNEMAAAS